LLDVGQIGLAVAPSAKGKQAEYYGKEDEDWSEP
jgi:hypothetical protein